MEMCWIWRLREMYLVREPVHWQEFEEREFELEETRIVARAEAGALA